MRTWLTIVFPRYGSVVTTHLLKTADIARQITAVILVDPVSILLNQPDVAYNFVTSAFNRKLCAGANSPDRQFADQDSPTSGFCGISGLRIWVSLIHCLAHFSGLKISCGKRIFSIIGALYSLEERIQSSMLPMSFRISRGRQSRTESLSLQPKATRDAR